MKPSEEKALLDRYSDKTSRQIFDLYRGLEITLEEMERGGKGESIAAKKIRVEAADILIVLNVMSGQDGRLI